MANKEKIEINDFWKFNTQDKIDTNGKLLGLKTNQELRDARKAEILKMMSNPKKSK